MATLSTSSSGSRLLQVTLDRHGPRKSIGIGRVSDAGAQTIRSHVDELVAHTKTALPVSGATRGWVADLAKKGGHLYRRLVALGLIEQTTAPAKRVPIALGPHVEAWIRKRSDLKPQTRIVLGQVRNALVAHFGDDCDLRSIDRAKAVEWNRWLKSEYAAATVAGHTKKARQIFREAAEAGLIESNPFTGIKAGKMNNPARQQYIPRETVLTLIAACPDHEWKLIFALARFGGLRTPSETFRLRWCDIDFAKSRMTVHSPKTERHPGREKRVVPILPDLLPFLTEKETQHAQETRQEGRDRVGTNDPSARGRHSADARTDQGHSGAGRGGREGSREEHRYEVGTAGRTEARSAQAVIQIHRGENLRTQAERIIEEAGLQRWPRLFQNLRSSFETDLATLVPLHVACAWTGNSEAVALGHYLTVTEEHFELAARAKTRATGLLRIEGGVHPTLKSDRIKGFADALMTPTGGERKRFTKAFLRTHRRARAKTLRLLLLAYREHKKALKQAERALSRLRGRELTLLGKRVAAARRRVSAPAEGGHP